MKPIITEISITWTGGTNLLSSMCPSSLSVGDFLTKIAEQLIAHRDGTTKILHLPGLPNKTFDRSGITSFTITTSW